MNALTSVLRIVAILAALAAVVIFFLIQGKLSEKENELAQANASAQSNMQMATEAKSEIEDLKQQLTSVENRLAQTNNRLNTARAEVTTATQEANRIKSELRRSNDQITSLNSSIRDYQTKLIDAEKAIFGASNEEELIALQDRISTLEATNEKLTEDLKSAQDRVLQASINAQNSASSGKTASSTATPTNRITYTPRIEPATLSSSIGAETKIASLDIESGIMILHNTSDYTFTPNTQLKLISGYRPLGPVNVVTVTEDYVVAAIQPETVASSLQEGLTVNILK